MNQKETIIAAIASLRPTGWSLVGYDFEDLVYDEGIKPITKSELDAEIKVIENKLKTEAETKASAKTVLLEKLGITAEEAQLLLS